MRKIISILLLFAFITVNFSKVIIWVHYELNKTQLTQLYCENKDKPMMHCCAKCLLKKKFARDDDSKRSPAMPDLKYDVQLFSPVSSVINIDAPVNALSVVNLFNDIRLDGFPNLVFHPPLA